MNADQSGKSNPRTISMALALTLAIFQSGCATNRSLAEAPEKAKIRYLAWGSPEQIALEQNYCDQFNQRNPDAYVSLMLVPGSAYYQKLILMLASRTAPDVMRVDHYNFPALVPKNYFYDLTEISHRDPNFNPSDFFPMTIREGTYEGKLFGLNTMFGGEVVYYNRSMIQKAGLEDPYVLWRKGQWDYSKLREYAIAMTKTDGHGRPLQFGVQIPTFPMSIPFVWGFGGEVLSADGSKCLLNSPGSAAANQYLADLRWKDHSSPSPSQGADSAFNFESGRIGMVFNWSGMSVRYRKVVKDFDWDVCPIPTGPKGGMTIVKGNQLVISRESPHPDVAWRFIRFLTSKEVETELYAKLRRNCPTRKAVAYSKEFLDATLEPHHPDTFVTGIETGRELPITGRWAEWTNAANAELDDLMSGRDRNAAQVVERAAAKANKVLAEEEGF